MHLIGQWSTRPLRLIGRAQLWSSRSTWTRWGSKLGTNKRMFCVRVEIDLGWPLLPRSSSNSTSWQSAVACGQHGHCCNDTCLPRSSLPNDRVRSVCPPIDVWRVCWCVCNKHILSPAIIFFFAFAVPSVIAFVKCIRLGQHHQSHLRHHLDRIPAACSHLKTRVHSVKCFIRFSHPRVHI